MNIKVLGRLVVTDDQGRALPAEDLPRRARQLLGVLAARHDRIQSKDSLADALWGEELPGNHAATLEHYVSVVRKRLQPQRSASESFIVTRSGGYVLDTSRTGLDLAELRHLVQQLDGHPPDDPARLRLQQQILDLATDLPFPEDADADWTRPARNDVRAATLTALVQLAEAALADNPGRGLRLAEQAIELDPYVEQAYRTAMLAADALGRPDEALRFFERCRQVLDDELGIAPAPETIELHRAVLQSRRPAAAPTPARPPAPANHASARRPGASSPTGSAAGNRSPAGNPAGTRSPAGSPTVGGSITGGAVGGRPATDGPATGGPTHRGSPGGTNGRPVRPATTARDATVFVGRRTELDLLLDANPAPVVHLVGPPGAGKSALLAELRRRAPGRVGVGHGPESGSTPALRLMWLRAALTEIGVSIEALTAVDAAAMEHRPLSLDELQVLATELDRGEPVLLAVDDASELDETSVAELAWLGRRQPLLSVVLTCRYPSASVGRPIGALGTPIVLRLNPLTDTELAEVGEPALPERTGGIPALVGTSHRAPEVAAAVAMQIARSRTRWMPEASWEVLRLSAALGSLRVTELAALTGQPVADVLDCVDQLIHAHLLVEEPGGRVRHRSGLIRSAIAAQVSNASGTHLRERLATFTD